MTKEKILFLLILFINVSMLNATSISPDNSKIQYFGRWDHSTPTQPIGGWGSVYIKIKFTGTGISIKLNDAANAYQYSIDGGAITVLQSGQPSSITLASGLNNTEHSLAFYRRSGGGWGRTVFNGFEITGGDIIDPASQKCLKFEFVGNSISVGFNNEGAPGSTNSANTENGYMSWGPQLARLYDGDWRVEAHSGQGMYMNLYNNPNSPDQWTMADEFELQYFPVWIGGDNQKPWTFNDGFQPDVFMCALGTNDFANASSYPTRAQFNGRYNEFLNLVRSKYPNAIIILFGMCLKTWDVPGSQWDIANDNLKALVEDRKTAGDNNIFFVNPRPDKTDATLWLPNQTDYVGDWTHPTVAGDAIIASKMKAFMDGNTTVKNKLDQLITGCSATAIDESDLSKTNLLNVYPNPAYNILTIDNMDNQTTWKIYNQIGELVQQGSGKYCNIENLSPGVYHIVAVSGEQNHISCFVKE